jgi:hypothetical protein
VLLVVVVVVFGRCLVAVAAVVVGVGDVMIKGKFLVAAVVVAVASTQVQGG